MDEKTLEEVMTSQRKTAFYPGCSLEGTAASFMVSLRLVVKALGVEVGDLRDWNCCGATSAHALAHEVYLGLNLRNLALVRQQGFDEVIAPCAACYHRLASTAFELNRDKTLSLKVQNDTGIQYDHSVKVRNILDFMVTDIGLDAIARQVKKPLRGLKVACYYGCLNTRVPRMESFDDVDYPMSMDRIMEAVGAEPLTWSYKTECCGASLFLTSEQTSAKLVAKILKDAIARGADCIAVACPMCHNNLDTKQNAWRKEFNIARPVPIIFFSQLMGLALGLDEKALRLSKCFVPFSWRPEMSVT